MEIEKIQKMLLKHNATKDYTFSFVVQMDLKAIAKSKLEEDKCIEINQDISTIILTPIYEMNVNSLSDMFSSNDNIEDCCILFAISGENLSEVFKIELGNQYYVFAFLSYSDDIYTIQELFFIKKTDILQFFTEFFNEQRKEVEEIIFDLQLPY